jgi:hypothetical protein
VPFNVPLTDPAVTGAPTSQVTGTAGVVSAIRDASARSGMPFDVMLASASLESGLNPGAQASTSSATGLFQFIDQTWLGAVRQYGAQHGLSTEAAQVVRRDGQFTVDDPAARQRILDLRKNPTIASALAGDHLRTISDNLGLTLGRPPDATEIYLGHLLGGTGASQMLQALRSAPNQSASGVLPAAARANPSLFNSPDGTPYSITQFMEHMRARVGRAYASVGAVMPTGPIAKTYVPPQVKALNPAGSGGKSAPPHARQPIERQTLATLTEVINHLDTVARRGQSATRHHGKSQQTLPAGLMATLRGSASGKAA